MEDFASALSPLPLIASLFFVYYLGILIFRNYNQWQECEDSFVDENPKIKVDPAKALAARVKFVIRLKRKMKQFKESKIIKEEYKDKNKEKTNWT